MNSSQNDGLRDAISNKKIMSYKLMSKVPGGEQITQQIIIEDNLHYQPQEQDLQILMSPP